MDSQRLENSIHCYPNDQVGQIIRVKDGRRVGWEPALAIAIHMPVAKRLFPKIGPQKNSSTFHTKPHSWQPRDITRQARHLFPPIKPTFLLARSQRRRYYILVDYRSGTAASRESWTTVPSKRRVKRAHTTTSKVRSTGQSLLARFSPLSRSHCESTPGWRPVPSVACDATTGSWCLVFCWASAS